MPSEALLGQQIWKELIEAAGQDTPALSVLHELLGRYLNSEPEYIPGYELEKVVVDLGYQKQVVWKEIVDLLCFKAQILELNFRLVEGDDHHEVSYETLQLVLSGESVRFGQSIYTAAAAQRHIFPYFVPTKQFHWLLIAERAANA